MKKKTILIGIITFIALVFLLALIFFITSRLENKNSLEPLLNAEEKGVLSEQGKIVLNKLIEPLNGESGTLISTAQMEVGYLAPMPPLGDRIMVFILGTEVEKIEETSISWLKSLGFSEADLCNLPVVFSITDPNAQTTSEYKLRINYLPDFCMD